MTDVHAEANLRLFIALDLPEPVRAEIRRVQRELQLRMPRDAARWTRPDQFHLTLRFLGDVPADRVEELNSAIRAVCRAQPALALRAQGIGFFPNARAPRVIWVGVNDEANCLVTFQQRLEVAVGPFSRESDAGNFSGHITLARLRHLRPARAQELAAAIRLFEGKTFGEWTAGEIGLIRSELSQSGARHTTVASFPLGDHPKPAGPPSARSERRG